MSLNAACLAMQAVCMADNNRADTQLLDGGGAACFVNNEEVWALFNSVVAMPEPCEETCPPYPPSKSGKKCTGEPPLNPEEDHSLDASVDRNLALV